MKVRAECKPCGGTGLYQGFAEPPDTAVVCLACGGSGCAVITYKPFKKRKKRRGIKYVQKSAGSFVATGVGPVGDRITVDEFYARESPR